MGEFSDEQDILIRELKKINQELVRVIENKNL